MKLVIAKSKYSYSFVYWLLTVVRYQLIRRIPKKPLFHIDALLALNTAKVLHDASQALHIKELQDVYIIEIDPSVRFGKTNVPVASLCKTVSYGSLNHKGYTLFNDVFNFVSTHLSEYYDIYLHEYYI